MAKRYDVIVIGAGLGGLSAATLLARRGRRVLLLERHNIPGGYATSFVRGRYEFEIALHELSGIGPPGESTLYDYLADLGVAERVEFVPVHELYRTVLPDLDVVMPVGRQAYEAKICETFPHEADGIRRFLARLFEFREQILVLEKRRRELNPVTALAKYRQAIRYLPTAWGDVLGRDVKDPRAQAVLSQYWGYFGLGPAEASFLYFAMALTGYMTMGPSYVKGRSQALSNAFIAAFESHGGEVRFGCGARRITTGGGRVTGVITDHDEAIEADAVISNADPVATCVDMIGPEQVPASFFRKLRTREIAPGSVNVYLGVDAPAEELGFACHENFVNATHDSDLNASAMDDIHAPPGVTLVTCYNTVWPEISPPGTSMVVLTTLHYGEPWQRVAPSEYHAVKERVAERMIAMAETISPNLRSRAEVVEVATPLTNMRYAGALNGSIYGFSNPPDGHTVLRLSPRGPLGGLFFAGAWTQPGGGFEPCMMSGASAGKMASRFLDKRVVG